MPLLRSRSSTVNPVRSSDRPTRRQARSKPSSTSTTGWPLTWDTRELANAVRTHWPAPGEIVFIEESALYGLRFYLDVPVERVTLTAKDDPAYDSLLLEELAEHEARVFVTTANRLDRIEQVLTPAGFRFIEEERIERYVLGRIEPDA